jgi:hypothetical protein
MKIKDTINVDALFDINVLSAIPVETPQINKTYDPVIPHHDSNLESNHVPMVDLTSGPIFSLGHSEAAVLLDTACTQRNLEFHNSNWLFVCHFFSSGKDNDDYLPQVQLILCNQMFRSTFQLSVK